MKLRFNFIKYLSNLKFAVFLLLLIAGFSIIGSLVEQNQSVDFYEINYQKPAFGFVNANIILKTGLDHIFKTWWFISLLVVFGLSLTCCTFIQQLPALEQARKIKFLKRTKVRENFINTNITPPGKYIKILKQKQYTIFQSNTGLYANKGLHGRGAPIVVHFSIILILIGSILASTSGFVAQEIVPESEIFYVQNVLNNNINTFLPHISGRVNDFWVSYKEDRTVKQFYTDLSLIDNKGHELKRETIYVNHPLKYKGLTFYQTDWDILGLRIKNKENSIYQLPVLKTSDQTRLSWIPTEPEFFGSGYTFFEIANRGSGFLFDKTGALINKAELNEPLIPAENNNTIFLGLVEATGIQIKADPGLFLIYCGFFLLIISIFTSYISYSQIWFIPSTNKLSFNGLTNRAKITFEFEILNFILKL